MIVDDSQLLLSEPPTIDNEKRGQKTDVDCLIGRGFLEVSSSPAELTCNIYFSGSLFNRKDLCRHLNFKTEEATDTQLVKSAYHKYGRGIKKHLFGDFSLVVVDYEKKVCLVWRHQLSSYPLYLSCRDNKLLIGQRLKNFQKKGFYELDDNALTELLHWGVITGNLSIFKGVSQLEAGELQIWKLDEKPKLTESSVDSIFAEYAPSDSNIYGLEDVNYQVPINIKSSEAFKLLPDLALRQEFPVTCQNQIESYRFLKESTANQVICDLGLGLWGRVHTYRYSDAPPEFDIKSLYLTQWARSKRPVAYLNDRKTQLEKLQLARGESSECWRTWIKLRYWLPFMQGLLRNQAESFGKEIFFLVNQPFYRKFGGLEPEISFLRQSNIWKLNDEPILNLFESMQRLFAFGTKGVSKKIFHFAPPVTGNLIRRFHDKSEFQEFCTACLTLDYLSRFNNWTIE